MIPAFMLFRPIKKEMLSHLIWGITQAFRVAPVFKVCLILLCFNAHCSMGRGIFYRIDAFDGHYVPDSDTAN